MALTYEEQIRIEIQKIKELKRKQKLEQKKMFEDLGRMLCEQYPDINPENFEAIIAEKSKIDVDETDTLT